MEALSAKSFVSCNLAADKTDSDVVLQATKDGCCARQEPC